MWLQLYLPPNWCVLSYHLILPYKGFENTWWTNLKKLFPQWTWAWFNEMLSEYHFEEIWCLKWEEEKQRCSVVSQSVAAHLCSWAISWLRSSSSLLPVSSTDPAELPLSWGGRHRPCRKKKKKGGKNVQCSRVGREKSEMTMVGRWKQ